MCTISFVPTARGFRLAMNRDETRARVAAVAPEIFTVNQRRAIYPREPSGGTWLAANDAGVCLALINWHRIERDPAGKIESRGHVIPTLIGATDARAIGRQIRRKTLQNLRPFRLIAIDPRAQTVIEWRWNLTALTTRKHRWQIRHWFSSGYNEPEAERARGEVCAAWRSSLGEAIALKRLHASHLPQRGPFSICMHRPDAATVSYSEVNVSARRVTLRYSPRAPCRKDRVTIKWLPFQHRL